MSVVDEELNDLIRVVSQKGLCSRRKIFFLFPNIRLCRHDEAERPGWCHVKLRAGSKFAESTYRKGDFATFGHLLGEDSQEVEDACVALGAVTERLDHGREHIVPILHLNRQDRQAYTELHSYGLGPSGEVLEQEENLVSEGGKLAWRDLGREVVGQLRKELASTSYVRRVGYVLAFPRRVMAAKRVASGSALDWRMPMMVAHESFCRESMSMRGRERCLAGTNRFLEPLQVVMGLGLVVLLPCAHRHDGSQDV